MLQRQLIYDVNFEKHKEMENRLSLSCSSRKHVNVYLKVIFRKGRLFVVVVSSKKSVEGMQDFKAQTIMLYELGKRFSHGMALYTNLQRSMNR